jgi:hypothetical protein
MPRISHSTGLAQTVGNRCSGRASIDEIIRGEARMPAFEMLRELVVQHSRSYLHEMMRSLG